MLHVHNGTRETNGKYGILIGLLSKSSDYISNLGYLALAQGNRDEARNYFATVLEYDPNDKIAANELLKLEKE